MKPLVDAFTLLTVVPLPFGDRSQAPSRFAPLFFPLVGLAIGVGASGAFALFDSFLPVSVAAALVLAFAVGISGALHVDGLADFADGVFGGRSVEDRIRIMKKSDVGAFGISAVFLVLLADWTSLATLTVKDAWVVLPIVGLISRTAPLVVMSMTSYVSANGLGQSYSAVPKSALFVIIASSAGVTFLMGGAYALVIAVVGFAVAVLVAKIAKSRVGGATGDVYGASIELSVAFCLIAAVAIIDVGEKLEPVWTNA